MKMLGANQRTNLEGLKRLEGHTSYFLGSDPAGWRTGVPQFEAVEQRDIYPGVDVIYYGSRSELEYDIIVAPGVEPSIVRLKFEGASRLRLDHGDLVIQTPAAEIRKERPRVYQK